MNVSVLNLNEDQLNERIEIISQFIRDFEKIREMKQKEKYDHLSYAAGHFNNLIKKIKENEFYELEFFEVFNKFDPKNFLTDCDQIISYFENYIEGIREILDIKKHPPEVITFSKKQ